MDKFGIYNRFILYWILIVIPVVIYGNDNVCNVWVKGFYSDVFDNVNFTRWQADYICDLEFTKIASTHQNTLLFSLEQNGQVISIGKQLNTDSEMSFWESNEIPWNVTGLSAIAAVKKRVVDVCSTLFELGMILDEGHQDSLYIWGESWSSGSDRSFDESLALVQVNGTIVSLSCKTFCTSIVQMGTRRKIYTWGDEQPETLGHDVFVLPGRVSFPSESYPIKVSTGGSNFLVLDNEGNLWVFGSNTPIGDDVSVLTKLAMFSNVTNVVSTSSLSYVSLENQTHFIVGNGDTVPFSIDHPDFGIPRFQDVQSVDYQIVLSVPSNRQCFGKLATDALVCSGHGYCVDQNLCICNGYIGEDCSKFEVPSYSNQNSLYAAALSQALFGNNESSNTYGHFAEAPSQVIHADTHGSAAFFLTKELKLYVVGNSSFAPNGLNSDVSEFTELIPGKSFRHFCAGKEHVVLLSVGNELYIFGNANGHSLGPYENDLQTPTQIPTSFYSSTGMISRVFCSEKATFLLNAKGDLFSFGDEQSGVLGRNDLDDYVFGKIEGLSSIVLFSCQFSSCFAVDSNETIYTWGSNQYGQLGLDSEEVVLPQILVSSAFDNRSIVQLSTGGKTSFILTQHDESLEKQLWGSGLTGSMGLGNLTNRFNSFQDISFNTSVSSIFANYDFAQVNFPGESYVTGSSMHGSLGILGWDYEIIDAPNHPPGRYRAHSFVHNDTFYIYGGDAGALNDMHGYSFVTQEWTEVTHGFPSRFYPTLGVTNGGSVIMYGGENVTFDLTSTIFVYDLTTRSTNEIFPSGNIPEIMYHESVMYNDKMYIFGGLIGSNPSNTLYELDIYANTFTMIPTGGEVPIPRDEQLMTIFDDEISVMGGYFYGGIESEYVLHTLSLTTLNWSGISTVGLDSFIDSGRSLFRTGDEFFLFDGTYPGNVYMLKLGTNVWNRLKGPVLGDWEYHASVYYDGSLWAFGGNLAYDEFWKMDLLGISEFPYWWNMHLGDLSFTSGGNLSFGFPEYLCNIDDGWNYQYDTRKVCGGYGVCVGFQQCICPGSSIITPDCEKRCYNIHHHDPSVCSGHGICTDPNSCSCDEGFTGEDCSSAVLCYGVHALSDDVCSGRGDCLSHNQCSCREGFYGFACQFMEAGVVICGDYAANDPLVCAGRGECTSNGCVCDSDDYTSESFCSDYVCFGESDRNLVCNGRGSCIGIDVCQCYQNVTHGFSTGSECLSCSSGFAGERCNVKASDFNFKSDGASLVGSYSLYPLSQQGGIACSRVLKSVSKLGQNPSCLWPNGEDPTDFTFEIILGFGARIVPGDTLTFLDGPDGLPMDELTVGGNDNFPNPIASVKAPSVIGACGGIVLDGSDSSSDDRRSLKYHWDVTSADVIDLLDLRNFLHASSAKSIYLSDDLLLKGNTYNFTLTVVSSLSGKNDTVIHQVTKLDYPLVGVSVPSRFLKHSRSQLLTLFGRFSIDPCFDGNRQLSFRWTQIGGPHNVLSSPVLSQRLVFPSNEFPAAGMYVFRFRASSITFPERTSFVNVQVEVVPQELILRIRGGNTRVSVSQSVTLIAEPVDPDETRETEHFSWTCELLNGDPCPVNISSSGKVLSLSPNQFEGGSYRFIFTFTKGDRSQMASTELEYVYSTPPAVSVLPLERYTARSKTIVARAQVSSSVSKDLSYSWKLSMNGQMVDLTSYAFTRIDGRTIGLKAFSFAAGTRIQLAIEAGSQLLGNGRAFAETIITGPPVVGSLSISRVNEPNSRIAVLNDPEESLFRFRMLEDEVRLSAQFWQTAFPPLRYAFGYIIDGKREYIGFSGQNSQSIAFPMPFSGNVTFFCEGIDRLGSMSRAIGKSEVYENDLLDRGTFALNMSRRIDVEDVEDVFLKSKVIGSVLKPLPNGCNHNPVCSGHGSCVDGSCVCVSGYLRDDCSLTVQKEGAIIEAKEQLLSSIHHVVTENDYFSSEEDIGMMTETLLSLTSEKQDLNKDATSSSIDVLKFLVEKPVESDETLELFTGNIDHLIEAVLHSDSTALNETLFPLRNIALYMVNTKIKGKKTISGGPVYSKGSKGLKIHSKKVVVADLSAEVLKTEQGNILELPSQFLPLHYVNDANEADGIEMTFVKFKDNVYDGDDIKSETLIIDFSISGEEITIHNLSEPMNFTIVGNYPLSSLFVPSCEYFNETSGQFQDDGCVATQFDERVLHCSCTHATAFGAFFRPNINLLTFEDVTNISKLNQDNLTTMIVMFVLALVYIVLMIILEFSSRCCIRLKKIVSKHQYQSEDPYQIRIKGYTRPLIEQWKRTNIWYSIISMPVTQSNFSRMRRLTIIYMIIIGVFAANAVTFGQKQENEMEMVASIIVSDALVTPFILLFSFLFMKTRGPSNDHEKKVIKPLPVEPKPREVKEMDQGAITELSETEWSKYKISLEEYNVFAYNNDPWKEEPEETSNPKPARTKESKFNGSGNLVQKYHEVFGYTFDLIDTVIMKIEKRMTSMIQQGITPAGIMILLMATFLWFGIIALLATLSTTLHWITEVGVFLISTAGIVVYIITLEYLFLSSKLQRYHNSEMGWRPKKFIFIIQIVICSIGLLVVSLAEIGIIMLGLFSDVTWENISILSIGFAAIGICIGVWLFMLIRVPKRRLNSESQNLLSGPWFSHLFCIPIYICCWIWIGSMSFILVLYGIRFDAVEPGSDKKWLLSSLLSTAQNAFINKPLLFLFRAIMFVMIIRLFENLFFREEEE